MKMMFAVTVFFLFSFVHGMEMENVPFMLHANQPDRDYYPEGVDSTSALGNAFTTFHVGMENNIDKNDVERTNHPEVEIYGLKNEKYNGLRGHVVAHLEEEGRVMVKIKGITEMKSIKEKNLKVVKTAEAKAAQSTAHTVDVEQEGENKRENEIIFQKHFTNWLDDLHPMERRPEIYVVKDTGMQEIYRIHPSKIQQFNDFWDSERKNEKIRITKK